jgi:hypothetical protein
MSSRSHRAGTSSDHLQVAAYTSGLIKTTLSTVWMLLIPRRSLQCVLIPAACLVLLVDSRTGIGNRLSDEHHSVKSSS